MDVGSFDRVVLLVIVIEAFPLASVVTSNEKDQRLFLAQGVRKSPTLSLAQCDTLLVFWMLGWLLITLVLLPMTGRH